MSTKSACYFKPLSRAFIALSCLALFACNDQDSSKQSETSNPDKLDSTPKLQDGTPAAKLDGKDVFIYKLVNKAGMAVQFTNYGASVMSVMVPDKKGEMGDVVLGFDSIAGFMGPNNPHMNSVVGRYANRISKAKFSIDGKEFNLPANNKGNSIHGGLKPFDKKVWDLVSDRTDSSISFKYESPDGEEGFPGKLVTTVTYIVGADNSLSMKYHATTDKPTVLNLTNHGYFNLSAGKDSLILNHEILIYASKYTPVDTNTVPTGKIESVAGTPLDFTKPKKIGASIAQTNGGYDNNYVLENNGKLKKIATVSEPISGRVMDVFTTQPGVQFYTGNNIKQGLEGKNGIKYGRHTGFCLETQHYPDSPNKPQFPTTVLRPGEEFNQTTIYKFSTK